MVKEYECPNCGKMNSMYPVFSGRKRYYQCDDCKTNYSHTQLNKAWGRNKNTPSIEVTPLGI